MIKLAIDAMGGDYAPKCVCDGVNEALSLMNDIEVTLYGNEEEIKKYLVPNDRVKIVHSPEALSMGVHDPIREIRSNKNLSLVRAFQAVRDGECDGAVTAGPTQGVVVAAHMIVKRMQGMNRIALCPILPEIGGKSRLILDVGANTDIRPEHMLQHALFAKTYVAQTMGISNPVVGLINIGAEEGKGRELEKETYAVLKNDPRINFYGNIEPKEMFTSPCDILLTDGYSGNMIIKSIEGTAKAVGIILKDEINKSFFAKIGYLFMSKVFKNFKKRMSADEVGGALIFGVNGTIVKCHGNSDGHAFACAIRQARNAVKGNVISIMKEIISQSEETNE